MKVYMERNGKEGKGRRREEEKRRKKMMRLEGMKGIKEKRGQE